MKLRNARLESAVFEITMSPSMLAPGKSCGLAVVLPNETYVRSGNVSQYIPPWTLSRRGNSRLVRRGRLESVKFSAICAKAGAEIFCKLSEDEIVRFP